MSKRHKMSRSGSKRYFTGTALNHHPKNSIHAFASPMRGGIRL